LLSYKEKMSKYAIRQIFKERLMSYSNNTPLAHERRRADEEKENSGSGEPAFMSLLENEQKSSGPVTSQQLRNKRERVNMTVLGSSALRIPTLLNVPVRSAQVARQNLSTRNGNNPGYAIRLTTMNRAFEKDSY
jgi:hypothetical protein